MKRILGIAVVLGLVGVLSVPVMAQEAKAGNKMENSWLWVEGTKFTGTTLVFTSDKKIGIKPSKEKLHIYSKNYGSNWDNPSAFFGFKSNASARIDTPGHMYLQGPDKTIGEDYSSVTFKFENLKVDGSEMTGTCSYEIKYGFKGDKQLKELKGDKVPVKFISSGLITITSNQPNPNNAGQPGDPKIPEGPLTPSEKFDQDVLKEIQNLIKDNPGKTDLELQKAAEKIRKKGDSPKWVAVEHYFFALHYTSFLSLDQSPTGMTAVIPAIGGMALGLGWEAWDLSFGNLGGAAAQYIMRDPVSRWPGPRGDFQTNILRWGTLGTMGWRP